MALKMKGVTYQFDGLILQMEGQGKYVAVST